MPPRVSRRSAATVAKAAIAAEAGETHTPKPARAGRRSGKTAAQQKPRPAGRTAGRTKAAEKERATPERRTPARGEPVVEIAPPDTLLAARRTRPRATAAASPASKPASKPAPKTRRSPRGSRAAGKKTRTAKRDEATTESDGGNTPEAEENGEWSADGDGEQSAGGDVEQSAGGDAERLTDESVFATDTPLATPTKTRSGTMPMLVVHTPKSIRQGTATRVAESPSPKPPLARRGQKRVSDLLDSPPLAKRGRTRATQPAAATSQDADSRADMEAYVDIVSPSKFEASRSMIRQRQQSSGAAATVATAAAGRGAAQNEAGGWRSKYEDLLELRQSQPEREYEEFRTSAQERFDAAEEVIANLRKEIAGLKLKTTQRKQAADPEAEASVRGAIEREFGKQIAVLREQVEALTQDVLVKSETIERLEKHRRLTETSTDYNLRQKLRVMEEVTGLTIDDLVAEDQGLSYICKQSAGTGAGAGAAGYVLTVFDDLPGDYQYTPFGDPPALARLPGYLQESISFERASAGMFFWRMCNHLHQLQLDGTGADSPALPPPEGST